MPGGEQLPSIRDIFPDYFPLMEEPEKSYTDAAYARRKYGCDLCEKRFQRPSSLQAHMVSHTGERPHACPITNCTKRYSTRSNMKRHVASHSKIHRDSGLSTTSNSEPTMEAPGPSNGDEANKSSST
ncbi:hypothetical protein PHLGIDRAFT_472081 [Phlebiopsis gigantea 11061_1 CR5-6]|uniref:C2H2-type domain-containing protein n=1 Tax=Phlebiopsis gigantea (strain 11061_1 CR5-6) TaxID=745531 RepID=A0A0C3NM09_PHLG1|nr:hypothetical protein PHLGIDRAFT_472081 [Phlebiopsis gigantea 11061_1 CR5-6]